MEDESIPSPNNAPRIDPVKYEKVKSAMTRALKRKALTYTELMEEMKKRLEGFDGSKSWYSERVKVDLLEQNIIEKLKSKPVKYALV